MMTQLMISLAQAGPTTQPAPTGGDFFFRTFLPILLMIGVFYWFMIRSGRKERQAHQNMLNSLKRNDRVQTVGGVYGTVVDVRDNEVVLKVDESSNVKIRFNRSAIKEVLREPAPTPPAKS